MFELAEKKTIQKRGKNARALVYVKKLLYLCARF